MEEEEEGFLKSHNYDSPEFSEEDDSDGDFGIFTRKTRSSLLFSRTKRLCACYLIIGVVLLCLLVTIFSVGLLIGHFGIPYSVPDPQSSPSNPTSKPSDCNTTKSTAQEICEDPPVLLISLDGFRASYFERNVTPFLDKFASEGVRAQYMRSVYPTKTFPNHFSIATGLYPESHGIVNNAFYDTKLREQFYIGSRNQNDPKWWRGEPIWVTAALNKLKTGVYFWPGSAVKIQDIRPDFFFYYDSTTTFEERVNRVLSWLDYPKSIRPQFMALYFDEPDEAGHEGGPDSLLVEEALRRVDNATKSLYAGLEQRGIKDCVNMIMVSDHGMGTYNESMLVYLPDYVPPSLSLNVTYPSYGPVAYLDTNGDPPVLQEVFDTLVNNGSDLPMRFYLTQTIPYRLHAGHFNRERYSHIQLIGNLGAYISSRKGYKPVIGEHGYDNINEEMHAIFQARGPAFKTNYTCQAFDNIHLYSLMCGLLGIPPAPNNGTTGALYHLLTPALVSKLPTPQAYPPSSRRRLYRQTAVSTCPFPANETDSRVFCEECVCYGGGGEGVGCDGVTNETIVDANRALNVMSTDMYLKTHLPWGMPSGGAGPDSCLLVQQLYASLYSNKLRVPMWTAYKLTREQVQDSSISRSSCSRRDPRLSPSNSANCTQYTPHPSFDVTVANISYTSDTLIPVKVVAGLSSMVIEELSTSLLSNYVLQSQQFNARVWKPLQDQLRRWASLFNTIHVISGVVLDTNHDGHRDTDSNYKWWANGEGSVAVPTQFYTIAVRCLNEGLEPSRCSYEDLDAIGLLFQHPLPPGDLSGSSRMLKLGLTPVRDIERLAGIDFFPLLSAQDQNTIELRIVNRLWPIT